MRNVAALWFWASFGYLLAQSGPGKASNASSPDTSVIAAADPDEFRLRFDVNLVQVDAVVTDARGNHVSGLKASDFQVLQDGKPQTITHFLYVPGNASSGTANPAAYLEANPASNAGKRSGNRQVESAGAHRTFLLFIDDIDETFAEFAVMRRDLLKFVDTELRPGDLWALYKTSGGSGAWEVFSADREEIRSAVEHLKWLPPAAVYQNGTVHTALLFSRAGKALDALGDLPGRKVFVFLNGGVDTFLESAKTEARKLADRANRASVSIYSLDFRGLPVAAGLAGNWADASEHTPRDSDRITRNGDSAVNGGELFLPRPARYALSQDLPIELAQQTGGLALHDRSDFLSELRLINDDNSGYYLLGWDPGPEAFLPKNRELVYHKIKVSLTAEGLRVRTRAGFYGVPSGDRQPPIGAAAQMDKALFSPFKTGDIGVEMSASFHKDAVEGTYIQSLVRVAPGGIRWVDKGGGCFSGSLELLTSPESLIGDAIAKDRIHSQMTTLEMCGDAAKTILRDGLIYVLRDSVSRPGPYEMRIAVRNLEPGDTTPSVGPKRLVLRGVGPQPRTEVGSAMQFVEVPDLAKRDLALSGLTLSAHGADALAGIHAATGGLALEAIYRAPAPGDPATRDFAPGDSVTYRGQLFRGRKTAGRPVDLKMTVVCEGNTVYSETLALAGDRIEGTYRLDRGAKPGQCEMQVQATENEGEKRQTSVETWVDFRVMAEP